MRLGQPFWLQQLRNNPETPSSVFLRACALGEHRKMPLRKAFLAGSSLEEEPHQRSPEQIAAETRLCNLMDADAPAYVINDAIAHLMTP